MGVSFLQRSPPSQPSPVAVGRSESVMYSHCCTNDREMELVHRRQSEPLPTRMGIGSGIRVTRLSQYWEQSAHVQSRLSATTFKEFVVPAQAEIQSRRRSLSTPGWIPAFAGMTIFGPDRLRYESRAVQNSIQRRVDELRGDFAVAIFARVNFIFPVA